MNEWMKEWKNERVMKSGKTEHLLNAPWHALLRKLGRSPRSQGSEEWKKKTEKLHMHTNLKTQGYEHGNFQEQNIKLNILKKKYV